MEEKVLTEVLELARSNLDMIKEMKAEYKEGLLRAHTRIDELQKEVSGFDANIAALQSDVKNLSENVAKFYSTQNERMWKLIAVLVSIFSVLLGAEKLASKIIGG